MSDYLHLRCLTHNENDPEPVGINHGYWQLFALIECRESLSVLYQFEFASADVQLGERVEWLYDHPVDQCDVRVWSEYGHEYVPAER